MAEIEYVTNDELEKILDTNRHYEPRPSTKWRYHIGRFDEKTWDSIARGKCKSEDCLYKKLSMPVLEILKQYEIRLESALDLIDLELWEKLKSERKFSKDFIEDMSDKERMQGFADWYSNLSCTGSSAISPLPIKEEYLAKVNDWISKNILEFIKNTGEIYRGVGKEHINDLDSLIATITKNGIKPYNVNGAPLIGLSARKKVADDFVRDGIFLVIDPKGLDLKPVKYGTSYQNEEVLPNRIEAEVRTPYIPPENIKKIYILKEADKK